MYVMQRLNVVKTVDSKDKAAKLVEKGFHLLKQDNTAQDTKPAGASTKDKDQNDVAADTTEDSPPTGALYAQASAGGANMADAPPSAAEDAKAAPAAKPATSKKGGKAKTAAGTPT